jgi:hypothetical protein
VSCWGWTLVHRFCSAGAGQPRHVRSREGHTAGLR